MLHKHTRRKNRGAKFLSVSGSSFFFTGLDKPLFDFNGVLFHQECSTGFLVTTLHHLCSPASHHICLWVSPYWLKGFLRDMEPPTTLGLLVLHSSQYIVSSDFLYFLQFGLSKNVLIKSSTHLPLDIYPTNYYCYRTTDDPGQISSASTMYTSCFHPALKIRVLLGKLMHRLWQQP